MSDPGSKGMRTLAVCADDFGMSPGVSQVIARLARAGRVNATSCLTNASHWRTSARLLKDLPNAVDVGLHFNLSEGEPLSLELRRVWPQLPALPGLIANAHLRRLPLTAIAAEFAAQHAAFVEAVGRSPAFVDGHQHVHHLPGVRELVIDALGPASSAPAIRNTGRVSGPGFGIKRALIAGTGGKALQRELARRGIAHNPALVGVYDFMPEAAYKKLMKGWLASVPSEGALLFCHPGAADGARDAIARARVVEAEYFASNAFADDLLEAKVNIGRVWRRI
ncbi:MAG: ChbG/HpnK family deacetylase [Burkholderiales bacterium]|jgi:chitin disaccharide deacetylase|nr:ChbG/HpnK family deacetylase [Burkholderiales bacterium]